MLDVCLLGTGGMMPLPGRSLTSLMTRYNGSSLLIDCGEGTQVSIRMRGWSVHDIDVICFTHFHADHISGLPGLLLSMGNSDRTEPVTIIGPKGVERIVENLRIIAPELPFDIKYIELEDKEQTIEIKGYKLTAYKVNHNVICYGYTIDIERTGKFQPDKAMELNIPQKYWNRLQKGEIIDDGDRTLTPDMVLGPKRKGIKVAYCTDTRPTTSIVDNVRDATLFVCEGMYGEKDKQMKAKEHKHMTFYEAAKIAKEASVEQMWLTHFSPSMNKPDMFIKDVRKIFENTIIPKDRRCVELDFDKEE